MMNTANKDNININYTDLIKVVSSIRNISIILIFSIILSALYAYLQFSKPESYKIKAQLTSLNELDLSVKEEIFDYPTAIISTQDENVVELAKSIHVFLKKHEFVKIKMALLDNQVVEEDVIGQLAQLPSKEMLIGKLIGSCNSPIQKLLYCLSGPISGFVSVLNNIAEKKQKEV